MVLSKHICHYQGQIYANLSLTSPACQRGIYIESLWNGLFRAGAPDTLWAFRKLPQRQIGMREQRQWVIEVIKVQLLKIRFINYPGRFHRLTLLGNCVAIHFADRHLGRHLLKGSGRERAAPFCRMASRVPPGVQGFTGRWSGSGVEHSWDILGTHCCTEAVLELVEAWMPALCMD